MKKLIKCSECGKLRPKTRQHILGKRYGTTLEGRNKKEECNECQKFFDNTTINEARSMAKKDSILPNKEISLNNKNYLIENSKRVVVGGGFGIINTGSSIQAISVEAKNFPHTSTGFPVALVFDNSAPQNEDRVKIINNQNQDLTIYASVIVNKPLKISIERLNE